MDKVSPANQSQPTVSPRVAQLLEGLKLFAKVAGVGAAMGLAVYLAHGRGLPNIAPLGDEGTATLAGTITSVAAAVGILGKTVVDERRKTAEKRAAQEKLAEERQFKKLDEEQEEAHLAKEIRQEKLIDTTRDLASMSLEELTQEQGAYDKQKILARGKVSSADEAREQARLDEVLKRAQQTLEKKPVEQTAKIEEESISESQETSSLSDEEWSLESVDEESSVEEGQEAEEARIAEMIRRAHQNTFEKK
jgi:hypothetical protein